MSEGELPQFGTYESSVLRNLADSNSVRTTIPQVIATLLGAAPGSILVWSFDAGARSATVRVKSTSKPKKSSKRG